MSQETFETCVAKLAPEGEVVFSGFSEPFLNPSCTQMILHAHHRGHPVRVFTTLVGLELADVDRLARIPFKSFIVHLPDHEGLTKINPDADYFAVLQRVIDRLEAVHFMFTRGPRPEEDIHPEVKSFLKARHKFIFTHTMHLRCGNVEIEGLNLRTIWGRLRPCSRFDVNVLLPNGDVVLCCMDFGQKHILGNLLHDSFADLKRSPEFQHVLAGLEDESRDILCRTCFLYASRHNLALRTYDFVRHKLSYFLKVNVQAALQNWRS